MQVSWYNGNIYDSICQGHLTIEQWINSHRNPKPHVLLYLVEVAQASKAKNFKLKQELKSKLFYITPSVYIPKGKKRQYANIEYFTGYAQLDFDKIDSIAKAKDLRDEIFHRYNSIVCAYLSPSKLGVKCIMQIPRVQDVDEYKDYYQAIETEMKKVHSGFDHAPFNCVLPLFISVDSDIKWRNDAIVWDKKEDRTVDYKHLNKVESEWGRGLTDVAKSLHTVEQFKRKIDEITNGDGHPRLRSACLVLGSRVGAGYIDYQQATELAHYAIQSNGYLLQKQRAYLRTADWCIKEGYNNPSYY